MPLSRRPSAQMDLESIRPPWHAHQSEIQSDSETAKVVQKDENESPFFTATAKASSCSRHELDAVSDKENRESASSSRQSPFLPRILLNGAILGSDPHHEGGRDALRYCKTQTTETLTSSGPEPQWKGITANALSIRAS